MKCFMAILLENLVAFFRGYLRHRLPHGIFGYIKGSLGFSKGFGTPAEIIISAKY